MEKAGIPGVLFITNQFVAPAISSAQDNGVPNIRMVVVPTDTWYLHRAPEEIDEGAPILAGMVSDKIIDALTSPLTEEEKQLTGGAEKAELLTYTGENYAEAYEAMQLDFYARHISDGLSFAPPTPEAIDWMLTGTSRSRDEVIGVPVPPAGGIATIEKIAANAVMAGAEPRFLPVIIAAMEIITREDFNAIHLAVSASGPSPVIVVNGPIAEEISMRSGRGFLNTGNRANNTISRAVRLCIQNFGHTFPEVNEMSGVGKVFPFGVGTFAESNELPEGWNSLAVDLGFEPEDSVVTVQAINFVGGNKTGGSVTLPLTPEQLLEQVAQLMYWTGGVTHLPKTRSTFLITLMPGFAADLKKMGFDDKRSVAEWLWENSKINVSQMWPQDQKSWTEGGGGEIVPLVESPDQINIVLAGEQYQCVWQYDSGVTGLGSQKITGATLTEAGQ